MRKILFRAATAAMVVCCAMSDAHAGPLKRLASRIRGGTCGPLARPVARPLLMRPVLANADALPLGVRLTRPACVECEAARPR